MQNLPVTLLSWVEHPPCQQRESERSARKSSCSDQARTETSGRAGGDWQQSADTTGFEEEGKCRLFSGQFSLQLLLSQPWLNLLKQEVKAAPNAEVVAEKAPVAQQPKKESPKVKHDVQVSSKCAAFKGSVHQNITSVVWELLSTCHDYKWRKG